MGRWKAVGCYHRWPEKIRVLSTGVSARWICSRGSRSFTSVIPTATAGRCSSCPRAAEVGPNRLAVKASEPEDYERFGVSSSSIAPWEDGARTDNSPGSYEWWYFDSH